MTNSYDYAMLAKTLIELLKNELDLVLIESDSKGKRPDDPFLTYTFISPYIPINVDITDNEQFECIISLTVHEQSKLRALSISERVRKLFRQFKVKNILSERKIVIVSASKVQARDNFITYDYERMAGFDLKLRLQDDFVDTTKDFIKEIEF